MNLQKTGQFIMGCRKEKGLTQAQVAQQLHVSPQAVSKWEKSKSFPDISSIVDLCAILGVSVNELLAGKRLAEEEFKEEGEQQMKQLILNQSHLKKLMWVLISLQVCGIVLFFYPFSQDWALITRLTFHIMGAFIWGLSLFMDYHIQKVLNFHA